MGYKFPFTELNLERRLEQATEVQRRAFLSDLAGEPPRAEEVGEDQEKGREIPSRPID